MGKRKPRNKAFFKGRHQRFSNASVGRSGMGPNPVAVSEYYARTEGLSERQFTDRPAKKLQLALSLGSEEIKKGLQGLFNRTDLQGFESFTMVKVAQHGDLSIVMLTMGEARVFVEKRVFPETDHDQRGDMWVKRSYVYPSLRLALTALKQGSIRWHKDRVNQSDQTVQGYGSNGTKTVTVVSRSLNKY